MTQSANNLIWIDLEMTGLDPDHDHIIEIATIITDSELNILDEGPVVAIYQEDSVLSGMDEWNTKQHGSSGLTQRVRDSKFSAADGEKLTLEFIKEYVPENSSPMCGNSICQDRRFLYREMPELERYFHYRNLDVSAVKEVIKRWSDGSNMFSKDSSHLAMDDIRDSIAELKHYRANFFNC